MPINSLVCVKKINMNLQGLGENFSSVCLDVVEHQVQRVQRWVLLLSENRTINMNYSWNMNNMKHDKKKHHMETETMCYLHPLTSTCCLPVRGQLGVQPLHLLCYCIWHQDLLIQRRVLNGKKMSLLRCWPTPDCSPVTHVFLRHLERARTSLSSSRWTCLRRLFPVSLKETFLPNTQQINLTDFHDQTPMLPSGALHKVWSLCRLDLHAFGWK